MHKQSKISIITINQNNAEGLGKTIASVKNQTYPNIEYVVIDGASTDNSVEIINYYKSHLSYWISENDRGMYDAMNKGILKSTGDYLLFLNSGDILSSHTTVQDAISNFTDEDIIYGDICLVLNKNKPRVEVYPDILNLNYFITGALPHQGMFIKRSLFSTVGLYSENLMICSDWKFQLDSICKFKCSYKHINLIISNFSGDGVSSLPENQNLILQEKESVLMNEYSFLKEDLQLYKEYKKLAFYHQYSNRVKVFRKLGLLKTILTGKYIFNYNNKEGF